MERRRIKRLRNLFPLLIASAVIGVLGALLADTLKMLTEHYEHVFFGLFQEYRFLIFIFPCIGFLLIHVIRRYIFNNNVNRGITEAMDSVRVRHWYLPAYKIPSHYFNGFLTVITGGSTGIEVSTVVATATVGSISSRKTPLLRRYKTELTCAGLAAGVTALFNAPIAGLLFAVEVFSRRFKLPYLLSLITAVSVAWLINHAVGGAPLFAFETTSWQLHALPYFMILGVLAGLNASYLTRSVLLLKKVVASYSGHAVVKIVIGSVILSGLIFFLPGLYGEGYHAIHHVIGNTSVLSIQTIVPIVLILLAKPVVTALTLSLGGDGGVFAPSLFIGAFLGWLTASVLNQFFGCDVIVVNFIIAGMAAVLSGSIHAPLTAVFLLCAIVGNYVLFVPVLIACTLARVTAKRVVPYTVYSYKR